MWSTPKVLDLLIYRITSRDLKSFLAGFGVPDDETERGCTSFLLCWVSTDRFLRPLLGEMA